MNKILVVIPAYNEGKNIASVVDDIYHQKLALDVLIINDGSQDDTSKKAFQSGALVADLPTNLGIGGARQTGLIYALKNNYDYCLQMDADGQHPAKNIKRLIKAARESDVVIGSRFLKKTKYRGALNRRLGIRLLSFILRLVLGQQITDPTSGLRIFSKPVISFLTKNYPVDYPEVEPFLYLHWAGFKIKEVPAEMEFRKAGKSSIAPVYYMIKVILAIIINLIREKPSREEP